MGSHNLGLKIGSEHLLNLVVGVVRAGELGTPLWLVRLRGPRYVQMLPAEAAAVIFRWEVLSDINRIY